MGETTAPPRSSVKRDLEILKSYKERAYTFKILGQEANSREYEIRAEGVAKRLGKYPPSLVASVKLEMQSDS